MSSAVSLEILKEKWIKIFLARQRPQLSAEKAAKMLEENRGIKKLTVSILNDLKKHGHQVCKALSA